MPFFLALSWKTIDENMFPCSVTARAGIFCLDGLLEQLVDPARAVEQRVLGVEVKVNELSHRGVVSSIVGTCGSARRYYSGVQWRRPTRPLRALVVVLAALGAGGRAGARTRAPAARRPRWSRRGRSHCPTCLRPPRPWTRRPPTSCSAGPAWPRSPCATARWRGPCRWPMSPCRPETGGRPRAARAPERGGGARRPRRRAAVARATRRNRRGTAAEPGRLAAGGDRRRARDHAPRRDGRDPVDAAARRADPRAAGRRRPPGVPRASRRPGRRRSRSKPARPVWEAKLPADGTTLTPLDDRLFVGASDRFFYCLSADRGKRKWRWRTGGTIVGTTVVVGDRVYFVSLDNVLRSLNRSDGNQRWKSAVPHRPTGGPFLIGPLLFVPGVSSGAARLSRRRRQAGRQRARSAARFPGPRCSCRAARAARPGCW